jgi:hypothetical protein
LLRNSFISLFGIIFIAALLFVFEFEPGVAEAASGVNKQPGHIKGLEVHAAEEKYSAERSHYRL